MSGLTLRQRNIIAYMYQYEREGWGPPGLRKIGDAVGITSTSVVSYNLNKLTRAKLVVHREESVPAYKLSKRGRTVAARLEKQEVTV